MNVCKRENVLMSKTNPSILQYMVMRLVHWQNGMREWVSRTVIGLTGVDSHLSSTRCDKDFK